MSIKKSFVLNSLRHRLTANLRTNEEGAALKFGGFFSVNYTTASSGRSSIKNKNSEKRLQTRLGSWAHLPFRFHGNALIINGAEGEWEWLGWPSEMMGAKLELSHNHTAPSPRNGHPNLKPTTVTRAQLAATSLFHDILPFELGSTQINSLFCLTRS